MAAELAVAAAIGGFWTMLSCENPVSKGLGKLIEIAGEQIGYRIQSKNNVIRAEADAEIRLLEVRTELTVDTLQAVALNEAEIEAIYSLEGRAIARETVARNRKQRNFEQIVFNAAIELSTTPDAAVDDRRVDVDWKTQFFNYAQDIGSDEMQQLWAKLLAGELKRPGTVSLRTLSAVKNLSRDECELFSGVCQFVWKHENPRMTNLLITDHMVDPKNSTATFKYTSLQKLTDCGLVEGMAHYENDANSYGPHCYSYFGTAFKFIKIAHEAADVMTEAGDYQLTPIGKELSYYVPSCRNVVYFDMILEHCRKRGWDVTQLS